MRVSDLARLEAVHELLARLNDASASAAALAALVDRVPPLGAHLARRFRARFPNRPPPARTADRLALLGNHELEAALLQVLEDLTVLRAELDPEEP